MCGIFGAIAKADTSEIDKGKIKDSALLMSHRGPDAFDQWGIPNKIELAHLRLSIIDLSKENNQPFISSCKKYVIVFNGEIYNYVEIRKELESLGHKFRTKGDTEVLLNSYIEWGDSCVSKFNGDWAFAIYNIKENTLFCSRDRFGVKPFNYAIFEDQFIFSSEIKSILNYIPVLRRPNYNVIANFCRNSLGAQIEETWFHGIKRLLPAHNLIWKDGEIVIKKYWNYPLESYEHITPDEAINTYRELFLNAVKLRMRSDVPVGTTLSSGLDSSSIVSVLRSFYGKNHKTFTAIFGDDAFRQSEKTSFRGNIAMDEGELVKKLAHDLNLDAHLIKIDNNKFVNDLSQIIYYLESGHSSYATIPLSKILGYAKKHVTVVLEGQGADELLGGYILNVFPFILYEHLKKGNFAQLIKEFCLFRKNYSVSYSLKLLIRLLNYDWVERLYQKFNKYDKLYGPLLKNYKRIKDYPLTPPKFSEKLNKELFKAHSGGLVNLLHYGDAISMSKSMESRLPYMDVNLIEYVFKLPFAYKVHNGMAKYIHRISMENIVPEYVLKNPLKFGFNTPLSRYFEIVKNGPISILLSPKCINRGIFNKEGLQNLINQHLKKSKDHSIVLFRLLSVELWFRTFIDN